MRNIALAASLAILAITPTLGGCGDIRTQLGLDRKVPDEFQVVPRAPLSMPPNYALRPPEAGAGRPQESSVRTQVRDTLINQAAAAGDGRGALAADTSKGEQAFMSKLDSRTSSRDIRRVVDQEAASLAEDDRGFVERLMFWRAAVDKNAVVDATQESRRLRENTALGRPVTEGQTPTIERKPRGLTIF
ncbi:MAG: DUF3035 domain-containing protein [Alphaproteobacteria bacterium]|nr:DUF3035 domain-containing protein [Alphaproteobacteria bacterium]